MRDPRAVIVPSLPLPLVKPVSLLPTSLALSILEDLPCCLASQRRREEAAQERKMSKPALGLNHLGQLFYCEQLCLATCVFFPSQEGRRNKDLTHPWFNPELTIACEARLVTYVARAGRRLCRSTKMLSKLFLR